METSTNLGRVSLVPRGEYDPNTAYQRLDVVQYQGSGYLVLREVRGVEPPGGGDYMLLAARGKQGRTGERGLPGPPGEQGLPGADGTSFVISGRYGTLAELTAAHPAGTLGLAYAVGTADDNRIFLWDVDAHKWQDVGSLQGPQGAQGEPGKAGEQGAPGADGKTAYQYAVAGGYAGTEAEFAAIMAGAMTRAEADKRYIRPGGQYPDASYTQLGSFVFGDDNVMQVGGGDSELYFESVKVGTMSYTRINGVADPQYSYNAANKAYVDGLVGDIGTMLDTINGEVV